jgi:hypothetical protein
MSESERSFSIFLFPCPPEMKRDWWNQLNNHQRALMTICLRNNPAENKADSVNEYEG